MPIAFIENGAVRGVREDMTIEGVNGPRKREWLTVVDIGLEHDPNVECLGDPVYTIEVDRVLRTWPHVSHPALSQADLKAYAAEKRWAKETGGTVVLGTPIPTDDRAKVLLLGAAMSMADTDTAPFVVGAVAVTLTGAQFKALYAGLVAHVQACFTLQSTCIAAIDAGTITTKAHVDQHFA